MKRTLSIAIALTCVLSFEAEAQVESNQACLDRGEGLTARLVTTFQNSAKANTLEGVFEITNGSKSTVTLDGTRRQAQFWIEEPDAELQVADSHGGWPTAVLYSLGTYLRAPDRLSLRPGEKRTFVTDVMPMPEELQSLKDLVMPLHFRVQLRSTVPDACIVSAPFSLS
jgi:hypothetical protein